MTVETIKHASKDEWLKARTKDVTSSEVAALFDCNPYMTAFELWHRKKSGEVVEIQENERMFWGTRLQDAIAAGIAERENFTIVRAAEYMRVVEERLGSSFDFWLNGDGILEVKNVDSMVYRDGWILEGDVIEAPPHIELQVQHQLAVSGRKYAYIGALVGGNRVVLIHREPDAQVISAIKDRVAEFWKSIDDNKEPTPDWGRDADFIAKLHGYAEPGKLLDVTGDAEFARCVEQYKAASEQIRNLEEVRDAFKAQILTRIKDAEKVKGETTGGEKFTISAGLVGPAEVAYTRQGFRMFKVSYKKEKSQ